MKLLGIGDSDLDVYLRQRTLYPGGNSVNVPALALRCGAEEAGYIGVVGSDAPGRHLLRSLQEEGVDISRTRVLNAATAQNFIEIDADGDRHFVGNNGSEVAHETAALRLNVQDYAYIQHYSLSHTSIHSFIGDLLPALSRWSLLSMDYSDGYNRVNIAQYAPLLRFAFFSGGGKSEQEVRDLASLSLRYGAKTVVVTMGLRGSYILEEGREHRQKSTPANVTDALGAGDAYIAAFLVHYQNTGGDVPYAAQQASDFAAECCGSYGAFGHPMKMDGLGGGAHPS